MLIVFLCASVPASLNAIKMASKDAGIVKVGCIARRQSADVVAEMAEIAKVERARMVAQAAPTPTPTPTPGNYSQRRPVKFRKQINPVPPPSPEQRRVAAVRRRKHDEEEKRFIDDAQRRVGRPRTPTPPRAGEDPYGFAQWAQRRY